MKLDLAKDLFGDSWSRRDQLTSSTGTPISVLTAVAGGIAVLLANFGYGRDIRTLIFVVAAAVCVAGLIAAAYFIARSYHGYVYQEIPNAADLDSHCTALHDYHRATGGSAAEADADFDQYLAARFVEAADVNSRNNESKSAYLYRTTQSLIVGVVAGAVATIPWAVAKLGKADDPQRVTIETPVRVTIPPGVLNGATQPPSPKPTASGSSAATQSSTASSGPPEPPNQRGRATPPAPATAPTKTP
jgi:hypothetical protein